MELLFAASGLHPPRPRRSTSSSSSTSTIVTTPEAETTAPLVGVVAALEHATLATKHLSSASTTAAVDASLVLLTLASLRDAHRLIGSFLAQLDPLWPPVTGGDVGDEPMPDRLVTEDVEVEEASRVMMEVEEKMRECTLRSKRRRKRLAPPCWSTGPADVQETWAADPIDRRRWAIDLVFQFHG